MNNYLSAIIIIGMALGIGALIGLGVSHIFIDEEEFETTIHTPSSFRIHYELGKLFDQIAKVEDLNCDIRNQYISKDGETAYDVMECIFDDGTELRCQWNTFENKGSLGCSWIDKRNEN